MLAGSVEMQHLFRGVASAPGRLPLFLLVNPVPGRRLIPASECCRFLEPRLTGRGGVHEHDDTGPTPRVG
jgi:hypothetical protein